MKAESNIEKDVFQVYKDPTIEEQYCEWVSNNSKQNTINVLWFGNIIMIFLFFIDVAIAQRFEFINLVLRTISGPFLVFIGIKSLNSMLSLNVREYMGLIFVLIIQSINIFLTVTMPFSIGYFLGLTSILIIFCPMVVGHRFHKQIFNHILIILISLVFIFTLNEVEFKTTIIRSVSLILVSSIGLFLSWSIELLKRKNFEQLLRVELEKKHLAEKTERISNINKILAHDLKSPIRNINSFTTLLYKKLPNMEKEEAELLQYIKTNSTKMYSLVEEFLSYSMLKDEVNTSNATIDLNLLINGLITNYKKNPKMNLVVFTKTGPYPVIKSNENYLLSLFQNLIDNAIKYNDRQNKIINIKSKYSEKEYIISMEDNGIGIEEQYQEKIFQIFERLDPSSNKEGTGIGLAVCKEIMEKLGGRITLASESKKGSTFHLHFPLSIIN